MEFRVCVGVKFVDLQLNEAYMTVLASSVHLTPLPDATKADTFLVWHDRATPGPSQTHYKFVVYLRSLDLLDTALFYLQQKKI